MTIITVNINNAQWETETVAGIGSDGTSGKHRIIDEALGCWEFLVPGVFYTPSLH